jgi:membrane protein
MDYQTGDERDHTMPVENGHGRSADRPSGIPRRGWWDILKRVATGISEKNLSLAAAGSAYYAFLAIPSALTALIALYGLAFNPADVEGQVTAMRGVMPQQAIQLISVQLKTLTSHSAQTLGIGLAISLLVALWGALWSTTSMMSALNMAYGEEEKRSFVRYYLTAFALTVAAVVFAVVALALIAVLPAAIGMLPFGGFDKMVATIVRWPLLIMLILFALAFLYRYAPSREEPKWRWVSWGAVAAALLWIAGSALFSVYVADFATYNRTYGSLGAVVVLLVWLYVSSYAVLCGAELNAEIEHQTARDSTTGPEEPMGRRGAYMADTLGREG